MTDTSKDDAKEVITVLISRLQLMDEYIHKSLEKIYPMRDRFESEEPVNFRELLKFMDDLIEMNRGLDQLSGAVNGKIQ